MIALPGCFRFCESPARISQWIPLFGACRGRRQPGPGGDRLVQRAGPAARRRAQGHRRQRLVLRHASRSIPRRWPAGRWPSSAPANGTCPQLASLLKRHRRRLRRRSTPMRWISKRPGQVSRRLVDQRPQARLFRRRQRPARRLGRRRHRRPDQRQAQGRSAAREGDPAAGAPAPGRQQPADHRQRADAERQEGAIRAGARPSSRRPQPGDVDRRHAAAARRLAAGRRRAARLFHRSVRQHRRLDDPRPRSALAEGRASTTAWPRRTSRSASA